VSIGYLLGAPARAVTLEIVEGTTGDVIRRYSSEDPPEPPVDGRNIPDYWIRPAARLQTTVGLHRFVWNLRYAPPAVDRFSYPIAAVKGDTPRTPQGMFVLPGTYQVRLTVDGRSFRQAVTVRMDPRVKTSIADLTLQFKLSRAVDAMLRRLAQVRAETSERLAAAAGDGAAGLRARASELQAAYAPLPALFDSLQEADMRPTAAVEAAVAAALARAEAAVTRTEGDRRP
jgi:hypothetical protein